MRTPFIIIAVMVFIIGSAFVIRFVFDKKPLDEKITLAKSENLDTDKKDKNKQESKSTDKPGVNLVNQWNVPEILKEISAIDYIDAKRFACVQDELGKIFIYNVESEKIEKEIPFGSAGDYEGLALDGETAYVLRADGQIFEVRSYKSAKTVVNQYKTHLTEKHDTEGLAFDKANNRLLVSIKGDEPHTDAYKGIYAFDLSTKKMSKEPIVKIDLNDDMFAAISSGKDKKKKKAPINPSELAIHPASGEIYVLDGRQPKLLVMDKSGKLLSLVALEDSAFSQPEGMAFSPDGKLFISNEGTKKSGNILEIQVP